MACFLSLFNDIMLTSQLFFCHFWLQKETYDDRSFEAPKGLSLAKIFGKVHASCNEDCHLCAKGFGFKKKLLRIKDLVVNWKLNLNLFVVQETENFNIYSLQYEGKNRWRLFVSKKQRNKWIFFFTIPFPGALGAVLICIELQLQSPHPIHMSKARW